MKRFKIHDYNIVLDPAFHRLDEKVRFVLLSDLHGNSYGKKNRELLETIIHLNPDCILLAGDMITAANAPAPKSVLALLCQLSLRYPVFYANGNHETFMKMNRDEEQREYFQKYRRRLKKAGVVFLENESAKIELKGLCATIYGLEAKPGYFKRFHSKKMRKEDLASALGMPDQKTCNILIAHNPMDFPAYAEWGADLVLSGHLHGGFMRLPVLGGVVSPQMRLFPKYDKGYYELGGSRMIVSAGIGNHFPPPRLFNPRELVVIDFAVS